MAAAQMLLNGVAAARQAAAGDREVLETFQRAISATDDPRLALALTLERIRIRRSSAS